MNNRTPPNPYVVGNPLTDKNGFGFYGRQDVYDFLLQKLNATVRPAILLYGHRRIGKTSILRQMPRFMPDDWKIVFYDIQGQAYDTLDEILYGIAYEMDEVIGLGGVDQDDITTTTFQEQFLPRVYEKLGRRKERLVLLFDEFDILDPEKSTDVFNYLRSWVSKEQQVGYVFVVGRRPEHLSEIFRDMSTIVYNIGRLNRAETEALIRQPARGALEFPDETVESIWQLTSGHPLATQLLCFELWPRWIDKGSVPRHAIDEIIPDALKTGDNQLNQIYDGLNQGIYRLFLSAVADVADTNGVAVLNNVLDRLSKYNVNIGAKLNEVRSDLTHWDILQVQGDTFRYSVDLVRLWVAKNRSLDRMATDAPLASERAYRFYQTAEDLRMGLPGESEGEREANLQDAIVNYKRALQINPVLVAAQVGLSYALMEVGNLEEALDASRKAYDVDPAQREALTETLLRLGEKLESQGDLERAQSIYSQILDLGENQRARTRRQRIYIQQAENLALENRYEKAVEMLEQADAPGRREEIQKQWQRYWQKQKKIIDSLVEAKAWDEALGTISKYLELNPGDSHALIYQKEILASAQSDWNEQAEQLLRDGQLEESLRLFEKTGNERQYNDVLRLVRQKQEVAEIASLEKAGQWEQALTALNKYIEEYPQDKQTSGWRQRLREGYKADLKDLLVIQQASQEIDQAMATMEKYSREFPGEEAEALKAKLIAERRTILVDKAKKAAKQRDYKQSISLLAEVNRLDLAKSVVTSGKRVEWLKSLAIKLGLLVVLIAGLIALFVFIPTRVFSPESNFWLNTLYILLASGILYLTVWIFFGDLLLLLPMFLARQGSSQISLKDAKKLENLVGNRSYRRMAYSSMIAFTFIFLLWEFLFFLYIYERGSLIGEFGFGVVPIVMGEHPRIWLWMIGAILLGFFIGILFSVPTEPGSKLHTEWDSVFFWNILFLPAIFLVFIFPYLTHRWWGNYQIAHTIFLIIGLLFFGLMGLIYLPGLREKQSTTEKGSEKNPDTDSDTTK